MPGPQPTLPLLRIRFRPLETGAEEALEVFRLPFGEVFLVDFFLVLAEELESEDVSRGLKIGRVGAYFACETVSPPMLISNR